MHIIRRAVCKKTPKYMELCDVQYKLELTNEIPNFALFVSTHRSGKCTLGFRIPSIRTSTHTQTPQYQIRYVLTYKFPATRWNEIL